VSLASLPQRFFARSALDVARDLIGCAFLFDGVGGRIVETEAYREDDPPCHGYRGRTSRNTALFGPPGHLYVYFTYGMHFCANVVCERDGAAAGVLLRALEPRQGIQRMTERRGAVARRPDGAVAERLLCGGPARLAQALGIGREHNGLAVWREPLAFLGRSPGDDRMVVATPRIGVGGDIKPWRFVDARSAFLSRRLGRP